MTSCHVSNHKSKDNNLYSGFFWRYFVTGEFIPLLICHSYAVGWVGGGPRFPWAALRLHTANKMPALRAGNRIKRVYLLVLIS
jgi:hypothetical protein